MKRYWWPAHGDCRNWESYTLPTANLRINPATNKPDRDPETGCYVFDPTNPERVTSQISLPNSYDVGTSIKVFIHWTKTTSQAGGVKWRLEYQQCAVGGVLPGAWTDLGFAELIDGVTDTDQAYKHLVSEFPEIVVPDLAPSNIFFFRLWRQADDAADTFPADAATAELAIHYQMDGLGSAYPLIK